MKTVKENLIIILIIAGLLAFVCSGMAEHYAPVIFLLLLIASIAGWDFFEWLHDTKGQKRGAGETWAHLWPALVTFFLIPLHWIELLDDAWWIDDHHMPARTADGLGFRAVYTLLWMAALLVLIRAVRRGERGKPFTPIVLLLMDGWHLSEVFFTLWGGGAAGLLGYLPVGSRPWTKVSVAYLALYVIVRICAVVSLALSVGLDIFAWKHGKETMRIRWAALVALILFPLMIAFAAGTSSIAVKPRTFEEPLIQVELEDLRDGARITFECDINGNKREAEASEGDKLEVFTGANVYKESHFNWRLTSEMDAPSFMDEQGKDVPMDERWQYFLSLFEHEDGLADHVRVIRDGDLWFMEVEIADSLWRPFRLYGFDGHKLIQLAAYDTKRLTALKVLKPEAFEGVTVP